MVHGAAMGAASSTIIARAMAISALRAGDTELVALELVGAELAEQVRAAASALISGAGDHVAPCFASELEELRREELIEELDSSATGGSCGADLEGLKERWFTEARRLVLSRLSDGDALGTLSRLSVILLKRAAAGESWAIRLMTAGAARLSGWTGVSARLAPAIMWVSCALDLERRRFTQLQEELPPALAPAFEASRTAPEVESSSGQRRTLLLRLAEELKRIG